MMQNISGLFHLLVDHLRYATYFTCMVSQCSQFNVHMVPGLQWLYLMIFEAYNDVKVMHSVEIEL